MKHLFVVNPQAGKHDATEEVRRQVSQLGASVAAEVYVTRSAGDASRFVRERCEAHPDEQYRFYACGGDGTLNEVVSGVVGCPNAEMTCLPIGSGNDYVKYYGGRDRFLDLERLVEGEVHAVDVMRVNDRYSLNVCNFGFDAVVCRTMTEVRRKWLIGGRNAYTTGIVKALFTGRRTQCRVVVDGQEVHNGMMLLCTLGNGRYVGGAYQCSPRSLNDDGLIEVCLFKPLSLYRFATMLGAYRKGTFMERPEIADKMTYLRGRVVDIESPEPIDLTVDGEMMRAARYHIEQLPRAVRFVVPS
ncbi:MAG: YegS/Rv2252/BmrU family lipid kinase [Bacteroidales bacterium]|jgi:diacylglycerol kinase (ATP)|nr:YegS/Rv2252/BmrU family lipid kinase [Bacteroidales bacterium]